MNRHTVTKIVTGLGEGTVVYPELDGDQVTTCLEVLTPRTPEELQEWAADAGIIVVSAGFANGSTEALLMESPLDPTASA